MARGGQAPLSLHSLVQPDAPPLGSLGLSHDSLAPSLVEARRTAGWGLSTRGSTLSLSVALPLALALPLGNASGRFFGRAASLHKCRIPCDFTRDWPEQHKLAEPFALHNS